ncbi:ribonuclease P protein component [Tibeticola sediminis]|jgi:ribonuclease P protein component|uniref:Ribonuclease P protein component n=1 Tax=Tibeticola sediminis TaxID=1917811 RepID=A0A3N4UZ24_9BURK|nr:ribonuclease P protein component [Tibeticola sediminis]RPE66830.1 ribonuclease P protein component [Tibeticola sediminis]
MHGPTRSASVGRLKTRAQFQQVLAAGVWVRSAHFALHRLDAAQGHALGAVVPKRWARRAVTRNAIRRQMLELGERALPLAPAGAYVLRLCAPFDPKVFESATSEPLRRAVRSELEALLRLALHRAAAAGGQPS